MSIHQNSWLGESISSALFPEKILQFCKILTTCLVGCVWSKGVVTCPAVSETKVPEPYMKDLCFQNRENNFISNIIAITISEECLFCFQLVFSLFQRSDYFLEFFGQCCFPVFLCASYFFHGYNLIISIFLCECCSLTGWGACQLGSHLCLEVAEQWKTSHMDDSTRYHFGQD